MRLLHAGIHSDDQGAARTPPAANDGRDPSLFIGKFVPLRCLSRYRPCGQGSRRRAQSLGNACCSGGPPSGSATAPALRGAALQQKNRCKEEDMRKTSFISLLLSLFV